MSPQKYAASKALGGRSASKSSDVASNLHSTKTAAATNQSQQKIDDVKDFQFAYKKLAGKLIKQLLEDKNLPNFDEDELISEMGDLDPSKAKFLLLSDHEIKSMIEEEQSKMERGDPKNIHEALYSKHEEHKKRRQELMDMKDDGLLNDCTFHPNIFTSRSSKACKRS